jgi:hypothetical protein
MFLFLEGRNQSCICRRGKKDEEMKIGLDKERHDAIQDEINRSTQASKKQAMHDERVQNSKAVIASSQCI